jgi:hypothetical protein
VLFRSHLHHEDVPLVTQVSNLCLSPRRGVPPQVENLCYNLLWQPDLWFALRDFWKSAQRAP